MMKNKRKKVLIRENMKYVNNYINERDKKYFNDTMFAVKKKRRNYWKDEISTLIKFTNHTKKRKIFLTRKSLWINDRIRCSFVLRSCAKYNNNNNTNNNDALLFSVFIGI